MSPVANKPRVIVLGLDGASWNILKPLMEQGKLPTFKNLLQKGSYGSLKSILPPVSVPAWKCYSTGKSPGKLGIYNLLMLDFKNRKLTAPTSYDFKSPEIWDYLGEKGFTSCIYNMFATHPARAVRGCLISDIPNERGFYPRELKQEIEARFGSLRLEPNFVRERETAYAQVFRDIGKNFDVLLYLLDKYAPDFAHISIARTDGIQHFFWGDMERGDARFGKNIERVWIELDRRLSSLLDFLEGKYGRDFYLLIVSDHGFEGVKYRFNMGDWLVRRGYLRLNRQGRLLRLSFRFRGQLEMVSLVLEIITDFLRKLWRRKEQRRGVQTMQVAASLYERVIDWNGSAVIPLTGECLYVNKLAAGERKNFTTKLIGEISATRTPDDVVMAAEVVNGGEFYGSDSAPDVLILPKNVELYNAPLVRTSWLKPAPERWTGKHALHGVLIAYGPNVKSGFEVSGATLYDIAPTVLNLFGIPLPPDIDGKVIKDIFLTPEKEVPS